jgi:hypothetical protein
MVLNHLLPFLWCCLCFAVSSLLTISHKCHDAFLSTNTPPHVSHCRNYDLLNLQYTTLYHFYVQWCNLNGNFNGTISCPHIVNLFIMFLWTTSVFSPGCAAWTSLSLPSPVPCHTRHDRWCFQNYFSSLTIFFTKSCRLSPPISLYPPSLPWKAFLAYYILFY